MLRTGELSAKSKFLRLWPLSVSRIRILYLHLHKPFAVRYGKLDCFRNTRFTSCFYDNSVDYYFYRVLKCLFKLYFIILKLIHLTVYAHPRKAFAANPVYDLFVLALALTHHGCKHNHTRALRHSHYAVYYLIHALTRNLASADRTVRNAYSRIEKS